MAIYPVNICLKTKNNIRNKTLARAGTMRRRSHPKQEVIAPAEAENSPSHTETLP